MSIFSNKNFITQILKSQGCQDFDDEVSLYIQILVELQTRKLIETACKFMKHDHRDIIQFYDIEDSLGYMGHKDIILCRNQSEQYKKDNAHSQYIRVDPIYYNPTQFFNQQLKSITNGFTQPKFRGRWIYINGNIPKTNQNSQFRSLSDMRALKMKEQQEKNKKFNVIRDEPLSMLTKQQLQYYKMVTEVLVSPNQPTNISLLQPNGNIAALLPFFMKFLINTNINQRTIIFMLNLLENKFIRKVLLANLHQIIIYLMSYCGELSFKVGLKIGQLASQYAQKHPVFYDLFDSDDNLNQADDLIITYSTMLKKIAFQLYTGVPVNITPQFIKKCMHDATTTMDIQPSIISKSSFISYTSVKKMAGLCLNKIMEYWGQIASLREYHISVGEVKGETIIGQMHWSPNICTRGNEDPYLMMNL